MFDFLQMLVDCVTKVGETFILGDRAFYDLYKSWELVSGHNFIAFWSGAGITDDEVLKLIPHIKPSMVEFLCSNFWIMMSTSNRKC